MEFKATATLDIETQPEIVVRKPRRKRRWARWLIIFLLLLVSACLAPFVIVQLIQTSYEKLIYQSVQQAPTKQVAIVFGAGLLPNGTPSPMLADRLDAGISLYKNGKVKQLLLTGDNLNNREVASMRRYAVQHGVAEANIINDNEGMRTYDSCSRAANLFSVRQAILVTQAYHLPRALYLCQSFGIDAVGFKAGRDDYPNQEYYNRREFWATFLSWVDINISHPDLVGDKGVAE